MKKIVFLIISVVFICGCNVTTQESQIVSNEYAEQETVYEHATNTENIGFDEQNVIIDPSEIMRYENGIYFDPERYAESYNPFYLKKEEEGEIVNEFIWFDDGCAFEVINPDVSKYLLKSADHIELFKTEATGEENILGWFDYRFVLDGYVYFLIEGNLGRSTLDGSEKEWVEYTTCKYIKYKDGYIYYLHTKQSQVQSNLYRIKLDGTEKEQLSNIDSLDYCLAGNGVIQIVKNYKKINIIYEEFGESNESRRLGEFEYKQNYIYQIVGVIDNVIYICAVHSETILEVGNLELYSYKDDKLEPVFESKNPSDIKNYSPFIHGDYIYYMTKDGLFEFDPETNSNTLIAETMFAFGKIKQDSTEQHKLRI